MGQPEIKLTGRGAIRVNSATFLNLTPVSFCVAVDCREKRLESDILEESGGFTLILRATERTLHVEEDAPRDETGEFAATLLRLSGLPDGDWVTAQVQGKWGPLIVGVLRDDPLNESLPSYEG